MLEFRKDSFGNMLRYDDFGNAIAFGWELEYIISRALGGSTDPSNCRRSIGRRTPPARAAARMQTVQEAEAARRARIR